MLWNPVEDPAVKLFLDPRGETGQSIECRGSEPSPAAKRGGGGKKEEGGGGKGEEGGGGWSKGRAPFEARLVSPHLPTNTGFYVAQTGFDLTTQTPPALELIAHAHACLFPSSKR